MKRMIRIFAFLILVVSLIACAADTPNEQNNLENTDQNNTETTKPSTPTDPETPSENGGFLWRVENGDTTVYLQGTVHVGTEDFYPFHQSIEHAYESADVIVPEIDMTDLGVLSSLGPTLKSGIYKDGTTIKDHLPPETYEKLAEILKAYGMSIEVVKQFKPWMIEATITQLAAEELDYMHGVDMYFLERAKADEKEIIELESVADQFDVLAGQTDAFQLQQLEETLAGMAFFEEAMEEMFAIYLDGDENALLDLLFPEDVEMDADFAAYMKALNDDRNVKMAEKIAGFLEEDSGQTYFVIIGTAHLIKEPHVRTLLEEAGYEVERVY